jgi:hypothetical protein
MTRLFPPDDDVIRQIHEQLVYLAKIRPAGIFPAQQNLAPDQLSTIIESAFWASLRSDEGRATRTWLSIASPETFGDALVFETPIPLSETNVARLAPAVPRGGSLIVSTTNSAIDIRGFERSRSPIGFDDVRIEIAGPASIKVSIGVFKPFAVLDGRSNLILAAAETSLAHYLRRVLRKSFPDNDFWETQAVQRECTAFRDLARLIMSDGHGGIVLIVPGYIGQWWESLTSPQRAAV